MFIISFVYIIFLGCFFSDQAKFEFQHIIIDFSDMEIVASISGCSDVRDARAWKSWRKAGVGVTGLTAAILWQRCFEESFFWQLKQQLKTIIYTGRKICLDVLMFWSCSYPYQKWRRNSRIIWKKHKVESYFIGDSQTWKISRHCPSLHWHRILP